MLDPKLIRIDPDRVRRALVNRNEKTVMLDRFLELDELRRKALYEVEQLARPNATPFPSKSLG